MGNAVTRIALIVPSASVPVSGSAIDDASSLPVKVAAVATGATLLEPPAPLPLPLIAPISPRLLVSSFKKSLMIGCSWMLALKLKS